MNSSARCEYPVWQDFSQQAQVQRVPASGAQADSLPHPDSGTPPGFAPLVGGATGTITHAGGSPSVGSRTNSPEPITLTAAPAVAQALQQADEIVNAARIEAASLLQEAAETADMAAQEAHAEGFEAGKQAGLDAAQAETEQCRNQLQAEFAKQKAELDRSQRLVEAEREAILAKADAAAQGILAQAREEALAEQRRRLDDAHTSLCELAVAAAVRLVNGHLAIRPESIINMVSGGLRRLRDTQCSVVVGPDDLPLLEAQKAMLESALGAAGSVQLGVDPNMHRGDYVINSAQGQIDGRTSQKVSHIQAAMQLALGG